MGIALSAGMCLMSGCAAAGQARPPLRLAASWAMSPDAVQEAAESKEKKGSDDRASEEHWHVDVSIRGSYTKLGATKRQLDRRLDLPMRMDVLGVFDEPYTPFDRRSDLGLTTWSLGVGRQESERLLWTLQLGAGVGQDLNHQRFLTSTLEVDFRYAYYYTGLTAEYYPWLVPLIAGSTTWVERLQASRPFLLSGIETGYVSAEGEGDYTVGGTLVYHDEQKIRDWLVSVPVGVGWSFPIGTHWSVNLSGDYRFHFYRPDEYNGWNWTTALRYSF